MATLTTTVAVSHGHAGKCRKPQSVGCFDCSYGICHYGDHPSCYGTSYGAKPANKN